MTENTLGYEKIPKLLKNFAIPSITASLVGSIYNIVDQIFIGQGVGYLGNAATNVSYPFSTICLAISLLIGIGSASRFSLYLGNKEPQRAARAAGNGVSLMIILGLIYLVTGEILLTPLLKLFGATTEVLPFAQQYAGVTLLGMPFLIITNGMSNLIRADGRFSIRYLFSFFDGAFSAQPWQRYWDRFCHLCLQCATYGISKPFSLKKAVSGWSSVKF